MFGVISDPQFMEHDTGGYHPESPQRVLYIHTLFAGYEPGVMLIDPVKADLDDVLLIHDQAYIDKIARTGTAKKSVYLDSDTICCEDSYDIALLAAGSVLKLMEMALESKIEAGFASIRPPGHHAKKNRAMGFCIFNNIAIAARKATKVFGLKRVLIVDFDVHHGNGTQDSFYSDKKVLYFSTHQYPFYPGTGGISETGASSGTGYTVNCPLGSGKTDGDYIAVYQYVLSPIIEAYEPELILVSAGFDAHAMDPIGGMRLSSQGFGAITGIIRDAAKKVRAPIIFTLEGGYNLNALRESIACVVNIMKGGGVSDITARLMPELDSFIQSHSRFWPLTY